MTTLWDVKDICENKHGGDPQSREAWNRIAGELPERRRRVLEFIQSRGTTGATCAECADALKVGMNVVSGRMTELKADNLIRKHPATPTRVSSNGNTGSVWIVAGLEI